MKHPYFETAKDIQKRDFVDDIAAFIRDADQKRRELMIIRVLPALA